MTKHPRYQHTPEDLFLHVYVFVDDWLKQHEPTFKLHALVTCTGLFRRWAFVRLM